MGRGLWAEVQTFLFHGSSIGGARSAAFLSLAEKPAGFFRGGERSFFSGCAAGVSASIEMADKVSIFAKGDFL